MTDTPDQTLSPSDAQAFREKCRAFLEANVKNAGITRATSKQDRGAAVMAATKVFQAKLAEAGLAGLTYPVVLVFERAGEIRFDVPVANPSEPREHSPSG